MLPTTYASDPSVTKPIVLLPLLAWLMTACSTTVAPAPNGVPDSIRDALATRPQAQTVADTRTPAVRPSLLPPLAPVMPLQGRRRGEPRFDLVVTEAPIQQVFAAIVSDTGYSILLRPRQTADGRQAPLETVTVNLKDVTLFETLDALRDLLGYEYTVDGRRIYVQPPELTMRVFQVDYVQGQRRGVSDIQVIGGASQGQGAGSGSATPNVSSGAGSSGSYASTQASALSSQSKADFWAEVEDATRTALGCQIAKVSAGSSNAGSGSSANKAAGSRADTSYPSELQMSERLRGREGCPEGRSVTVNAMTGTLLVRGMPSELRSVAQLLQSMQANVTRQVIIEAKIIDVELNAGAQQGINWSGFHDGLHRFSVGAESALIGNAASGGGAVNANASIGNLLGGTLTSGTSSAFSAGLGMALQLNNFSALINFLETQGQVHVLSSPRIATLNNQKAVLKVGSEEPFVTNISGGTDRTDGSTTISTPPTLTYQPFFSGISLDVTPQIDASGNITLHVHTMVNSVSEKQKISTPTSGGTLVPFAVNNIKETDSVIRTRHDQVVVIGGLMTESASNGGSEVPGMGQTPLLGTLFRKNERRSVKRELVVLLKPTVVSSDAQWIGDLDVTRRRIEGMEADAFRRANTRP